MDPGSPHQDADHLPEAEREEIQAAVGRGIISDGLIVGAIPAIIFTITYTYRIGRATVFNTPTGAINVDISRVFHTFFEAFGAYAPQIAVAILVGFAVPAVFYRRLTMSSRTILALYATTVLVAVTSGTGALLTSWLFVSWFMLVLLTLAIPLFFVVNWREEGGLLATAHAEMTNPTSHRTWIIRILSRAIAIAMTGAVTAYFMGVSFRCQSGEFPGRPGRQRRPAGREG